MPGAIAALLGLDAVAVAGAAGAPPPAPGIITVREARVMAQQLAIEARTANGRPYRWGGEEPDAGARPTNIQLTTAMPGGYDTLVAQLPRHGRYEYADLQRGNPLRAYLPGGDQVFDGRIAELPKTFGTEHFITVQAVGWNAHLKDDEEVTEVYVNRDLASFAGGSSVQHLLDRSATPYRNAGEVTVAFDEAGNPAVVLTHPPEVNNLLGSRIDIVEAWHRSPVPLDAVYYDIDTLDKGEVATQTLRPDWQVKAVVSDKDTHYSGAVASSSPNLVTPVHTDPIKGWITSAFGNERFLTWQLFYNNSLADQGDRRVFIRNLALFGRTGLAIEGTEPNYGFRASTLVKDIVSKWAPKLHADDSTVDATPNVIPHFVLESVTPETAIIMANRYELMDWFVYDDRALQYRRPGSYGRVWHLRESEGATLNDVGVQWEDLWQGVRVWYTDGAGERRSVGPPGSSADDTYAELADTDPANPLNAHGYTRRWKRLELPDKSVKDVALAVGQQFLAEMKKRETRGTAAKAGEIVDSKGNAYPVHMVKAGDRVRFMDHEDTRERRVIKTTVDDSGQGGQPARLSLDLDALPHRTDAIMEWLQVVQAGGVR